MTEIKSFADFKRSRDEKQFAEYNNRAAIDTAELERWSAYRDAGSALESAVLTHRETFEKLVPEAIDSITRTVIQFRELFDEANAELTEAQQAAKAAASAVNRAINVTRPSTAIECLTRIIADVQTRFNLR